MRDRLIVDLGTVDRPVELAPEAIQQRRPLRTTLLIRIEVMLQVSGKPMLPRALLYLIRHFIGIISKQRSNRLGIVHK